MEQLENVEENFKFWNKESFGNLPLTRGDILKFTYVDCNEEEEVFNEFERRQRVSLRIKVQGVTFKKKIS